MLLSHQTKVGYLRCILAWLAWANIFYFAGAQDTDDYVHFTSGVADPAPVPGQPFKLTWAGGQPSMTIYIVLHYQFPDTPNQNIDYGDTDILSNAPNNGSWVWNVPPNIFPGRYRISIGENPFLQSGSTGYFTILPSQTSDLPPGASTSQSTRTDYQTYNGCGLPPLPDFTYTGYQPPCTVTTDGVVTTLYPIVPSGASASFWGSNYMLPASETNAIVTSTTSDAVPTTIASGVYAQALQCPYAVTPFTTAITASGTETVFSTVSCGTRRMLFPGGVTCRATGFATYSASGSGSVCCPSGWSTTPLSTDLYCFTSLTGNARRAELVDRQDTTVTATITISDRLFAKAGSVTATVQQTTAPDTQSTHTTKPSIATKSTSAVWPMLAAIIVQIVLSIEL